MHEPKPSNVRPIKDSNVNVVYVNGEKHELPYKKRHGSLDVKTGIFTEYIDKEKNKDD